MLQYGLYARKSDDDRRVTEKSIGEQVSECRSLAALDELAIVWTAEESKSAMTPNQRPRYSQLVRLLRKGSINAILCWHVNRLVRNMEEGGELVQLMIDGVLKEIRTPHSIYRSGESIWPVVIEAATATQFSIDQRRTVTRAMEGNFRNGGLNCKAGPGYQNVRDRLNSKRGQVEPDPGQFVLIRKAWDLMLTETATIQAVVRAVNSWGYRVRPTPKMPEREFSYHMAYNMFRNPFYAGFVRQKGELVKGRHTPMVTVDEFQRVQRILDKRSLPVRRKLFHAYTGLMKCGYCGQQVTAEYKRLSNGTLWETYHCADTYNRCTQKGLAADKVRDQLASRLSAIRIEPHVLDIVAAELKHALTQRHESFSARATERKGAAAAIQTQISRLQEMWLSGLVTDPKRYKELEKDLLCKQGSAVLDQQDCDDHFEALSRNLDRAIEFLKTGFQRFAFASPERQGPIVKALGSFVFFGREKKIEVEVRPILRELVSFAKEVANSLEGACNGSQSKNKTAFEQQFCFGGPEPSGLEPACADASDAFTQSGGTEMNGLEPSPALLSALEADELPPFDGITVSPDSPLRATTTDSQRTLGQTSPAETTTLKS